MLTVKWVQNSEDIKYLGVFMTNDNTSYLLQNSYLTMLILGIS